MVECHTGVAARRRLLVIADGTLKAFAPEASFKVEIDAGRALVGSLPILHIVDGHLVQGMVYEHTEALRNKPWKKVAFRRSRWEARSDPRAPPRSPRVSRWSTTSFSFAPAAAAEGDLGVSQHRWPAGRSTASGKGRRWLCEV